MGCVPGFCTKAGEVIVDRIVDITDDVMTLIDAEGTQYTNKKIRE